MAPDRVLGQLNDTRNRIAPCTPTTNSGHKNMMHGLLAHRKRAWIEKREMATYMVDNVDSARKAWLSMEMQVSYPTHYTYELLPILLHIELFLALGQTSANKNGLSRNKAELERSKRF